MSIFKTLFSSAILAGVLSQVSYADGKSACDNELNQYGGHCSYVTGLTKNRNDGRFIKIYAPEVGYNLTTCVSGKDDLFFMVYMPHSGSNTDQYSICTDLSGTQCELVGTDTYFATSKGEQYQTTPNIFAVDLSAVKDKYQACSSSWSMDSGKPKLHKLTR